MYWERSPGEHDAANDAGGLPVFLEDVDLDDLVEELGSDTGPRRRRSRVPDGQPIPIRASIDDRETRKSPRIELILYTSASSEKSRKAVRAIQEVLKRYDASQVKFTMCDLASNPQDAETDSVVFTPTLVKQGPGPRTSIIGNLEQADILCDLLDASGVDRRWDD